MLNGNGRNGNGGWRTAAMFVVGVLMTASLTLSGWALSQIGSLNQQMADKSRSMDDLWKWFQAQQLSDEKWRDSEKAYDEKVQNKLDDYQQKVANDVSRCNDRINALSTAVSIMAGKTPPKSDIPP